MAKSFKKVWYFVPWGGAFPKSDLALIGEGMEGVERVRNFWDYVERADLIVFPDTYCADIVDYLRNVLHKRVFGAGKAEELENDRWKTRQIQKKLGLPTQKTIRIKGIDNLIEYLKENDNVWVKINSFRGDIESFHHDTWDSTQAQFMGELLVNAGAKATELEFIVEEDIEGAEPGYDGFVVNGQYPNLSLWGYEQKGTGYIGKISKYGELPEALRLITDKLVPTFKELGGSSFLSTELRVSEKNRRGYLIDPTVRAPMPCPSATALEIYSNLPEFIWNAAEGIVIDLVPVAKFGAGLNFESGWATHHWTEVKFRPEDRRWIKFRRVCKIDNKYYALPNFESIGSIIGIGNTIEETIKKVENVVKGVSVKEMTYSVSGLHEIADVTLKKAEKLGVGF